MYINKVPFRFSLRPFNFPVQSLFPSPFSLSNYFRPGYPCHVPFRPGV